MGENTLALISRGLQTDHELFVTELDQYPLLLYLLELRCLDC